MEKFYTVKSFAGLLEVSVKTIRREIKDKHLPCKKIRGSIRISDEDLNTYLEYCQCNNDTVKHYKTRKNPRVISMPRNKLTPHIAPYKLANKAS